MIDKLLYEIIEKIIGKDGRAVVDILRNKRDVNEFKIATKLKLTINQTRNLLYKLYAQDIVSFIRKKDKQRGWYIYYWSLDIKKSVELLARTREKELLQLSYLLKSREKKQFYNCPDCKIELSEETALNHNFACPECGNLLKLSEDKKNLEEIAKEIERIKKGLEIIYGELNKLRVQEEKAREKAVVKKKKQKKVGKKIVEKKIKRQESKKIIKKKPKVLKKKKFRKKR